MDSNEKEFNGIENEEVTETEVNGSGSEEVAETEAEGSGNGEAAESGNEEIGCEPAAEAAEENTADNIEADESACEPADGETQGCEAADDSAESDAVQEQNYDKETVIHPEVKKKNSNAPIIAIIIVLTLIVAALAYFLFGNRGNKYNKLGYVNVSGRTIQEIADSAGIELKDFLSEYSLPEDMPGDTFEINAIYNMPAKVYLQNMIGIGFDDMKQAMNIPEETTPTEPKTLIEKIKSIFVKEKPQQIDENTPWYIVEGELTVSDYSGGSIDQFKEYYGLGDDVTGETKLKEIQDQINQKTSEMLAEQQVKEKEQESKENSENIDSEKVGEASDSSDSAENGDTQAQDNAE